eukprot:350970-Chlamydomonas_euryale.AAC.2
MRMTQQVCCSQSVGWPMPPSPSHTNLPGKYSWPRQADCWQSVARPMPPPLFIHTHASGTHAVTLSCDPLL